MDWLLFKSYVSDLSVSRDALHIYAALAIQVLAALLARVSLRTLFPWLAVLAAELVNEGLDLLLEKEPFIRRWQIEGSVHDLINTMVLPTILMILVRYLPRLFAPLSPSREEPGHL
jgi:hypothetical protein